MEPEGSSQCSEEPDIYPYPETDHVQLLIYEAVIQWHHNVILYHTKEFRVSVERTPHVTTYKTSSDVSVRDLPHMTLKTYTTTLLNTV